MSYKTAKNTVTFRCYDEQLKKLNDIINHLNKGTYRSGVTKTDAVIKCIEHYHSEITKQ